MNAVNPYTVSLANASAWHHDDQGPCGFAPVGVGLRTAGRAQAADDQMQDVLQAFKHYELQDEYRICAQVNDDVRQFIALQLYKDRQNVMLQKIKDGNEEGNPHPVCSMTIVAYGKHVWNLRITYSRNGGSWSERFKVEPQDWIEFVNWVDRARQGFLTYS